MKRNLIVIVAALLLSFAVAAPSNAQVPQIAGGLDGTWGGCLEGCAGRGDEEQLIIQGNTIRLLNREQSGEWTDLGAPAYGGQVTMVRYGASAVITYFNTNGNWIENWTFSVTQIDADRLLVVYVRVVNNTSMAPDARGSKFSETRTVNYRRRA